jgi:hypothetical protein
MTYQTRGTRTRRRLRQALAQQQAERFVRLQVAQPLPPAEPVSALDFFKALVEEGADEPR